MFSSRPALIGISASPGVLPVLISGPFYMLISHRSSEILYFSLPYRGQWQLVAQRILWQILAHYRLQIGGTAIISGNPQYFPFPDILTSYEPCEKFIRTTLRPAATSQTNSRKSVLFSSPFLSIVIFSALLVLGPIARQHDQHSLLSLPHSPMVQIMLVRR